MLNWYPRRDFPDTGPQQQRLTVTEEQGAKTDKQGRIVDTITGRPLRDKQSRTYGKTPFMGKAGKPNPRQKKLDERIATYEEGQKRNGNKTGRRRPGSLSK